MSVTVSKAEDAEYGECLKIEAGGETVFVWGCGCCPLVASLDEPKIHGEWIPLSLEEMGVAAR